jgi:pyrimidine-specific ribonucleoside hydrolase
MKPVILDVDTGLDDACALLLAARTPDLDLKAVTCVGGNVGLDQVVVNTLTVLEAADRTDVPVARGAALPLLQPIRSAEHVHGVDGLGDLDWPRSTRTTDARHAVELLRDVLLEAAGTGELITLIPLAPMTNIALLLRTYPEAAAGLREIVFMGGAAGIGNATASAEFNIWTDPEAAAIVLNVAGGLGIPLTMYGLDVFYGVEITLEQALELIATGETSAVLAGSLIENRCQLYGAEAATIGDGGAVCAVIEGRADHQGVPIADRAVRQLVPRPHDRRHPGLVGRPDERPARRGAHRRTSCHRRGRPPVRRPVAADRQVIG